MADETGDRTGFEFQRLHGMGEELYEQVSEKPFAEGGVPCRIYAPVGGHKDLLAYLVRRLLENGANSSFVARVGDTDVPIAELLERPAHLLASGQRHPKIERSPHLFAPRENSKGIEFGSRRELHELTDAMRAATLPTTPDAIDPNTIMSRSLAAFPAWRDTPAETRATALEKAADALETETPHLMAVLAREAGKTIDDGIAEIREAVDFLRYYATEARKLCVTKDLPGPVGETNTYQVQGRGPFLCIAPWNFPLAIFLGQVSAALAAGNTVIAKPAPQTPIIGAEAVRILHGAGIPADALILAPGGADIGQALVNHPDIAGVAFTGSTATAKAINLALAQKDGPIVPLIAETGGINAMIADATALPEQVCDDVVASAFPVGGPALFGLPHPLRAGRRGRPDDRHDRGCGRHLAAGRPHGPGHRYRPHHRRRCARPGCRTMWPTTRSTGRARLPKAPSCR